MLSSQDCMWSLDRKGQQSCRKSVCKDFTNFRTSPFDFCQKRELFLFSREILAEKKIGYINVAKSIAYLRVIYLLLLKYFFD